jgi:DNA anti-recombination protein RmuC
LNMKAFQSNRGRAEKEETKMELANSMRRTVDGIKASYDSRTRALGQLTADTHKTLEGFASEREKMTAALRRDLSGFTTGLSKSVEGMLRGFKESHGEMTEEQAKRLSNFVMSLTGSVGSMLNEFQKDRARMSKELKNRLARDVKEIKTSIQGQLKEFREDYEEMTGQTKKDLSEFASRITNEVERLLVACRKESDRCRNDIQKASGSWQGMRVGLAKARENGGRIPAVHEAAEKTGASKGKGKKKKN